MSMGIVDDGAESREVFPFYVVCDVSRSMWDPKFSPGEAMTPHQIIESSLPDLLAILENDPTAYDIAHISIVAFGETAVSVLDLVSLANDPAFTTLPKQGATDFATVFDFLTERVAADFRRLTSGGSQSHTPAIFFLTDGNPQVGGKTQPDSAWMPFRKRFDELGYAASPVIVALGIGNVTEATLRNVASKKPQGVACVAKSGAAPGDLLRAIIDSIIYSIGNTAGTREFVFNVPTAMRRLN